MLWEIFSGSGTLPEKILQFLVLALVIIISLTVHEYSHGFVAYKLGDYTAKADGRLSLNPLHHLDPVGTIMLLVIGFGYAKPVPVNTRNFRKPRRDLALVSIAGPLSNFVLAFIGALLFCVMIAFAPAEFLDGNFGYALLMLFNYSIAVNIGLGLFNLIPIPPLDGSNVLMCMLPGQVAAKFARLRYYTQYIWLAIIVISWLPGNAYYYLFYPLTWLRGVIFDGFVGFWAMIFGV